MIRSLLLYAKYLSKICLEKERMILLEDIRRYGFHKSEFPPARGNSGQDRALPLDLGVSWLLTAQNATTDGGFGSYHLSNGWSSSYPETTGYIIPTLINYGQKFDKPQTLESAIRAADFLLGIQKASGGWQGGRVGENKPEIVFNTGQVIRGMIAAFELTGEKKYLNAAVNAGQWLASIQHPEGFWKLHALMEQQRVYDTFVDAPLLRLYEITGEELFREKAVHNLNWVIGAKMKPNGWFEDCDNTIRRNDKPILHTIAYTIDGLIDCGMMLKDQRYINAAALGASKLSDLFLAKGFLNGRYDLQWQGSEYFICTGGAQMAIIWLKMYKLEQDEKYLVSAGNMIKLISFIQQRNINEREMTRGAIPGSFPIWGRYEPFAFPNWATKFFCDALLLEKEIAG